MASRYWKMKWSYGYVGTDNVEEIDAVEFLGLTEEEIKDMSQEEMSNKISEMCWEMAIEQVEAYSEPFEPEE